MSIRPVNMKRMKLADMKPAEYNPRTIDEISKAGLKSSIDEFGLVEPIIINEETGNIVGGHQRYNKLVEEGTSETDVVIVSLTSEKEKMLNITLNNQAITGTYNNDMLSGMLSKIKSEEKDLFKSLNMDKIPLLEAKNTTPSLNVPTDFGSGLDKLTFHVTPNQKDTILSAIHAAIQKGDFPETGNLDKKANGLERVAEYFIS